MEAERRESALKHGRKLWTNEQFKSVREAYEHAASDKDQCRLLIVLKYLSPKVSGDLRQAPCYAVSIAHKSQLIARAIVGRRWIEKIHEKSVLKYRRNRRFEHPEASIFSFQRNGAGDLRMIRLSAG